MILGIVKWVKNYSEDHWWYFYMVPVLGSRNSSLVFYWFTNVFSDSASITYYSGNIQDRDI